ncbi:MAG: PilZ domain-containing protein [Nitrospirota bacterium]
MKSRRRFKRLSVLGSVRIRVIPENRTIEGYIANMSKTGMGAYIPKTIKKRTEIEIDMTYFDRDSKLITEHHKGLVAWMKQFAQTYAIGIKYIE